MEGPIKHLDEEHWAAVRAREPGATAYFARHLSEPCEHCEAWLARATAEPDELDALADEALLALAPAREPTLDEVGYTRLRRRLHPARPARWAATAATLAAAAALVLLVMGPLHRDELALGGGELAGLKGEVPLALELMAVARLPDGRLQPLEDGASVPSTAVVLLRYHATGQASALLVQEQPGQPPLPLGSFPLESGTHDLRAEGELAGVSLEEEQGPLTLALVARPGTTFPTSSEVEDALTSAGGELSVARVHIQVESGHSPP